MNMCARSKDAVVLIFLKAPRVGTVKTRLAKTIGDEQALATYRQLVERQLAHLPESIDKAVHFAPADAGEELERWLGAGYAYHPQCEGGLGERLEFAVKHAFGSGYRRVFCIGGDCPGLGVQQIEEAVARLDSGGDVVFGPTEDGGYYLLGLNQAHEALFREIPWSLPDTLKVSIEKADALGLSIGLLEKLYDVDSEQELKRAVADGLLKS